jgi:hypothetical protein
MELSFQDLSMIISRINRIIVILCILFVNQHGSKGLTGGYWVWVIHVQAKCAVVTGNIRPYPPFFYTSQSLMFRYGRATLYETEYRSR